MPRNLMVKEKDISVVCSSSLQGFGQVAWPKRLKERLDYKNGIKPMWQVRRTYETFSFFSSMRLNTIPLPPAGYHLVSIFFKTKSDHRCSHTSSVKRRIPNKCLQSITKQNLQNTSSHHKGNTQGRGKYYSFVATDWQGFRYFHIYLTFFCKLCL